MQHRTIFISDIHLGSPGCQAGMLLDFLSRHDADTIYLVGDIIDAWRLKRGWFWPDSHNEVVQAILARAHAGTRIIYVPGNHDEGLRSYYGTHFGGIEVVETADHVTADGRRFLVIHGDQFDSVIANAKWLAFVGDRAYEFALWLNVWLNRLKRLWGGSYWSLSNWAKAQVKQAVNYIGAYESVLATEAQRGGYDGIVCGHIHSAQIRRIRDLDYVNTGDWVESCTAVVEAHDGTLRLIDWIEETRTRAAREAGDELTGRRAARAARAARKEVA